MKNVGQSVWFDDASKLIDFGGVCIILNGYGFVCSWFGESRVPFPCQSSFDKFFPSNCYCYSSFLVVVVAYHQFAVSFLYLFCFLFLLIFFRTIPRQICWMLLDLNLCPPSFLSSFLSHARSGRLQCFISVSSIFSRLMFVIGWFLVSF